MTDLPQVYRTSAPNDEIPFEEVTVIVRSGQDESRHKGSIGLSWLPEPRMAFQIHDITTKEFINACKRAFTADQPEEVFLRIDGATQEAKVQITRMPAGSHQPAVGEVLSGALELGPPECVSHVVVHLPNLKGFFTARDRMDQQKLTEDWQPGRIVLEADSIRVTIEPVADCEKLVKELKGVGGYAITHVGKLEETSGNPIPVEKVKDVLFALFLFLSFACGSRVQPILPVGFDAQGHRTWELWANWQIDSWKSVPSWCDQMHGECVAELFPGFMKRYAEPLWREVLRDVIRWYVVSNRRPELYTDDAIVLTQAALEMLASVVLVEDRQTRRVDEQDFYKSGKWPASRKLRELLDWAGVPSEIPELFEDIAAAADQRNWSDGPQTVTTIRNCIVHAEERNREITRGLSTMAVYDACSLGLWYLELILLRLFDYRGVYANRLKRRGFTGDVQGVPWARDGAATTTE
jgi:hypothetical protein